MDPSGRSGFPSSCRKRPAKWPRRRLGLESTIVRCYPDLGTERTKSASWPKPWSSVRKSLRLVSADHHSDLHRNLSSFRVPDLRTKDCTGVFERRSDRFRAVLPLAVCVRAFEHHLVAKGKASSYEFCR